MNVALVTKLDRLGRCLPHLAQSPEELQTNWVGLIAVSQGIDTSPWVRLCQIVAVSEFKLT